jgi:hypothetical protein
MGSSRGAFSLPAYLRRQWIVVNPLTRNVSSVIHAPYRVGKTTTIGVVVFFIGTTYIIT